MNRNTLFAVVAAACAGTASAQAPEAFNDGFVSRMSRQEVLAELAAFKKDGVNPWSGTYDPLKYFRGVRSREEVVAEYVASRDDVAATTAEVTDLVAAR